MLQGLMVIYTLLVVAVNVMTDLVYGIVDPRVELKNIYFRPRRAAAVLTLSTAPGLVCQNMDM